MHSTATGQAWTLLRLGTMGAMAYGAAAFAIGEQMLPGGRGWALLLIWLAAFLGGHAIRLIKLPSLLGMLLSGVILVNLPGDLVAALPDSWSAALRAGALAVILMRCAAPPQSTSPHLDPPSPRPREPKRLAIF